MAVNDESRREAKERFDYARFDYPFKNESLHVHAMGEAAARKAKRAAKRHAAEMPSVPKGKGLGYVLSEEFQQQVLEARGKTWRRKAQRDLDRARIHHKKATLASQRAEARMAKWTREIRTLEKKARMSDAEVEQVRQRAATAGRSVTSSGIAREIARAGAAK